MISKIFGLGFIVFGIVWSAASRVSCKGLCSSCSNQQLSPCFFLFLFVGIIFIICGYSLATMKEYSSLPTVKLKKERN